MTQVKQDRTTVLGIANIGLIHYYRSFKITLDWENKTQIVSNHIHRQDTNKIISSSSLSFKQTIEETCQLSYKGKQETTVEIKCYPGITYPKMFMIIWRRSDITNFILVMSRFAKNLLYPYNKIVKTVFYYLKVIENLRIIYEGKKTEYTISKKYFNSNKAGNYITKKWISGFISRLNSEYVSWFSKCWITISVLLIKPKHVTLILVSKEICGWNSHR